MSETQREFLIREAKMQTEALQRIGVWRRLALSVMAIGGLVAYTGFVSEPNILRGVFGIGIAVISGVISFLIRVGKKNGKKNVEKILKAAEQL